MKLPTTPRFAMPATQALAQMKAARLGLMFGGFNPANATKAQLRAFIVERGTSVHKKEAARTRASLLDLQIIAEDTIGRVRVYVNRLEQQERNTANRAARYAHRYTGYTFSSIYAFNPARSTRGVPSQDYDIITLPTLKQLYDMTIFQLRQTGDNLHTILQNPFRRSIKRDETLNLISAIYANRMSFEPLIIDEAKHIVVGAV